MLSCVLLFETPMDCSMPGFSALHHLPELADGVMSIELVMPLVASIVVNFFFFSKERQGALYRYSSYVTMWYYLYDLKQILNLSLLLFVAVLFCCLVAKSCLILYYPMDCSLPAPLSVAFPRQERWNGLPFPSPGNLPNPGNESVSPLLLGGYFSAEHQGSPKLLELKWIKRGLLKDSWRSLFKTKQ